MATAHWLVTGRVQGVGFRWFVREQARRGGVSGWVRNRADGSVEIAARGADDALARLLAEVRTGPRGAQVSEVRMLPPDGIGDLPSPFTIHTSDA